MDVKNLLYNNYGIANMMKANKSSIAELQKKLSTGKRINTSADSPSKIGKVQRFTSLIRGRDVASKNIQEGISLIQTADSVLGTSENLALRLRDLAVRYNTETVGIPEKRTIEEEAMAIFEEMYHNINRAKFGDIDLFSKDKYTIQTGPNAGDTYDIKMPSIKNLESFLKDVITELPDNQWNYPINNPGWSGGGGKPVKIPGGNQGGTPVEVPGENQGSTPVEIPGDNQGNNPVEIPGGNGGSVPVETPGDDSDIPLEGGGVENPGAVPVEPPTEGSEDSPVDNPGEVKPGETGNVPDVPPAKVKNIEISKYYNIESSDGDFSGIIKLDDVRGENNVYELSGIIGLTGYSGTAEFKDSKINFEVKSLFGEKITGSINLLYADNKNIGGTVTYISEGRKKEVDMSMSSSGWKIGSQSVTIGSPSVQSPSVQSISSDNTQPATVQSISSDNTEPATVQSLSTDTGNESIPEANKPQANMLQGSSIDTVNESSPDVEITSSDSSVINAGVSIEDNEENQAITEEISSVEDSQNDEKPVQFSPMSLLLNVDFIDKNLLGTFKSARSSLGISERILDSRYNYQADQTIIDEGALFNIESLDYAKTLMELAKKQMQLETNVNLFSSNLENHKYYIMELLK